MTGGEALVLLVYSQLFFKIPKNDGVPMHVVICIIIALFSFAFHSSSLRVNRGDLFLFVYFSAI